MLIPSPCYTRELTLFTCVSSHSMSSELPISSPNHDRLPSFMGQTLVQLLHVDSSSNPHPSQ